ncbi:type I-C CRISPR-associated protein Cas7/Csd2 [Lacticaseibacillus zhaodongensis]|uniref:type I-C CRISPR-associated protein Cas7/Csd2 n=1 Tax=Lacticaseibacillus zhaodongensis TaxID=2668065 RepID=UPI0012D31E1F|nr:type I-C CRISPR-associated protein Cas7/Csd2 [Lacticaseibacillus zhaodongensis]
MTKVLDHKIDFTVVIGVNNANPNGDPLDGNRPRVDVNGYGEMSDVSIKRKIRNRWQDNGLPILIPMEERVTDGIMSIRDRLKKSPEVAEILHKDPKKTPDWKHELIAAASKAWIDVRAFGQVMPFGDKKLKDGLDGVSVSLRGPVTIQTAESVKPVTIKESQITKSINLETVEGKGSDTMGTKSVVPFNVYVCNGSINTEQADRTGFTDDDAENLKQALLTLFVNDESAARPDGSMAVLKLIWWTHSTKLGKLAPYKVHEATTVAFPDDARHFSQVNVQVNDPHVDGLQVEEIDGF